MERVDERALALRELAAGVVDLRNDWMLPERGGHSKSNALLVTVSGSKSSASATNTNCFLPEDSVKSPSGAYGMSGAWALISYSNSLLAAASSPPTSVASTMPFGIDQAPSSFLAQNGPPMWAIRTSTVCVRRNRRMPALRRLPSAAHPIVGHGTPVEP